MSRFDANCDTGSIADISRISAKHNTSRPEILEEINESTVNRSNIEGTATYIG